MESNIKGFLNAVQNAIKDGIEWIDITVKCHICGNTYKIRVHPEDINEYLTEARPRYIQDIFPYLVPADRELIQSHTCNMCWSKLFPYD